jgi:DnaJ-class molecular chaperone
MMERAFTGFAALEHQAEEWWDVLEVRRDASREVILANYRRLRSQHHPDKGGDPAKFHAVESAYRAATQ